MAMNTLQDVLEHELKDLYSAETQLIEALPKMAQAAQTPKLRQAFEKHLTQTKEHKARLEQLGQDMDIDLGGETCKAMQGLVREGDDLIKKEKPGIARDAALIAAAQRVEHYEMAGYGSARTYARTLGHGKVADTLQKTLDEEGQTDKDLTKLAETSINDDAVEA